MYFFFNDTATTEIYTLSLHDALPISIRPASSTDGSAFSLMSSSPSLISPCIALQLLPVGFAPRSLMICSILADRKSTRLNSSHANISYAVFCLKKKHVYQHHCGVSSQ